MKEFLKLMIIPIFGIIGIYFYKSIGVMSGEFLPIGAISGGCIGAPFAMLQIMTMAWIDERL